MFRKYTIPKVVFAFYIFVAEQEHTRTRIIIIQTFVGMLRPRIRPFSDFVTISGAVAVDTVLILFGLTIECEQPRGDSRVYIYVLNWQSDLSPLRQRVESNEIRLAS